MLNTTYKQLLFTFFSFFIVSTTFTQIDTPEKRLSRINFLHEKIFELDSNSNYVQSEAFFQIKEGRDSIAQNYPTDNGLRHSEFSTEAQRWASEYEQEADGYIAYLEIFIRKRRL